MNIIHLLKQVEGVTTTKYHFIALKSSNTYISAHNHYLIS